MVADGSYELCREFGQSVRLRDALERMNGAALRRRLLLPLLEILVVLALDLPVGQSVVCPEPAFEDAAAVVGHGGAG